MLIHIFDCLAINTMHYLINIGIAKWKQNFKQNQEYIILVTRNYSINTSFKKYMYFFLDDSLNLIYEVYCHMISNPNQPPNIIFQPNCILYPRLPW